MPSRVTLSAVPLRLWLDAPSAAPSVSRHYNTGRTMLQEAGFSDETIESALATLGVPPADTTRRNEAAKRIPESTELAECRAPLAWHVSATANAAGSPHEFVSTPHVHGCWPATE